MKRQRCLGCLLASCVLILTACGAVQPVSGQVVERTTEEDGTLSAFVVETSTGERIGLTVTEKTRVFSVTVRPIRSPVLVSTTKALRVPSSSVVRSTTWPETGCTAPHAVRISTQEANRHPRHRCRFICAPLLSTLNRRMSIPWKSGEYHPFLKKCCKDGLFCTGNGRRLRMGEPPAGNSGKKMILL